MAFMVDFSFTWLSVDPNKCPSNTSKKKNIHLYVSQYSGRVKNYKALTLFLFLFGTQMYVHCNAQLWCEISNLAIMNIIGWNKKQQWSIPSTDSKGLMFLHFNSSEIEIILQSMQRPGSSHDGITAWVCMHLVTAVHVVTSTQLCALWLLHLSIIAIKLYLKSAL